MHCQCAAHTSFGVEPRGFEPRTSAVQGRRSPRLSYGPLLFTRLPSHLHGVGAPGFEPGTSALSGPRSNRLSYAPVTGVLSVRCMLFAHKSPCAEDEAKPNVRNRYPQIQHTAPHDPMRLCQAVRHTVTTTSSRPVPPSMVQRAMLDHRVSAETDVPVSLERR